MDVIGALERRHSVRQYTGKRIPDEKLEAILRAGLLSASSRSRRPWELIVVRDREKLVRMSACRAGSARMLAGADAAVAVVADPAKSDVWVEDCSVVMANMHLAADSLGVGSCWIQGRLRETADGESTEGFLRKILGFPDGYRLEAVLSLGMPAGRAPAADPAALAGKIHRESF